MSLCCRTCDHRNHAVHTYSSSSTLLGICIITLTFKIPFPTSNPNSISYIALNKTLNNIIDAGDSTSHPTTFTSWSPCLLDSKTVIILTTASETCSDPASPVFGPVVKHLTTAPNIQHILLDYSIVSAAASSSEHRTPCDLIILRAPNPGIASVIGKKFGWDPKRSSLSAQMSSQGYASFNHPGDLIRDFWAWAELPNPAVSPSSSIGSAPQYESTKLRNTNSDEKNMSLFYPEDDLPASDVDNETLIMLFQWTSHADAERFKHPLQKSVGQNGEAVNSDLWERQVAHPLRQLQGIGATIETYKLELRHVEERIGVGEGWEGTRERSGSRRLSTIATGIGERVSGFWR